MSKAKLLLVDDDRVVLATLAEGLEAAGYTVLRAQNAAEALAVAHKDCPELAVLDMRLPDRSGVELARDLCNELRVPFVFLSAYGDEETVRPAVEEGALGYVVKPVEVERLIPELEAALTRARELAELRAAREKLTAALESERLISVAVGLVMERFHLPERRAFELLRGHARSQRRKLADFAREVIHSTELLNTLMMEGAAV